MLTAGVHAHCCVQPIQSMFGWLMVTAMLCGTVVVLWFATIYALDMPARRDERRARRHERAEQRQRAKEHEEHEEREEREAEKREKREPQRRRSR